MNDLERIEGRMWDLIVSVPDYCLSFYFEDTVVFILFPLFALPRWQDKLFDCGVSVSFPRCLAIVIDIYLKKLHFKFTGPGSSVGRVSAPGNGRSRFRYRAVTYQIVKNGTGCSSLGTQTYGVELGLVHPVSV